MVGVVGGGVIHNRDCRARQVQDSHYTRRGRIRALTLHCRVNRTNTTHTDTTELHSTDKQYPGALERRATSSHHGIRVATGGSVFPLPLLAFVSAAGRSATPPVGYRRVSLRTLSSRAPPPRAARPMGARDVTWPRGGGDVVEPDRGVALSGSFLRRRSVRGEARQNNDRHLVPRRVSCGVLWSPSSLSLSVRPFLPFPPVPSAWVGSCRLISARLVSVRLSVQFGSEPMHPSFHRVPLLLFSPHSFTSSLLPILSRPGVDAKHSQAQCQAETCYK